MMDAAWAALLAKYGQRVVLHQGDSTVAARAFLQPIREKGQAQSLPSPLPWAGSGRTGFYIWATPTSLCPTTATG